MPTPAYSQARALQVCRGCGDAGVTVVWDLAGAPYGDLFRSTAVEARSLRAHTLTLGLCPTCGLLQLLEDVTAEDIHEDYLYQTRVNPGLVSFYQRLGERRVGELGLTSEDLVIDVGGNDGSALLPYRDAGVRVLNIDPASRAVAVARERGVTSEQGYLDAELAERVVGEYGPAALVTAHYVAANVPSPVRFLTDLASCVTANGLVSVITGYHPDQFLSHMFDYISHDHLSFFSVRSFRACAERSGLVLCSVSRNAHKGGSVRLDLRRAGVSVPDESVALHLQQEQWREVGVESTYRQFASHIERIGHRVRELLDECTTTPVPGIGASISTTHLLAQFGLTDRISVLLDDDPRKVGLFAPGSGLPVAPLEAVVDPPHADTVIILSWQVTNILMSRLREVGFTGRVVLPLPTPTVVTIA
ncbi:MAG: methyltransferase domain-containing protein [Actinomycetales bacterium]|nr:methyltransferase domain-containing protein [Actinomycetales bacterium]